MNRYILLENDSTLCWLVVILLKFDVFFVIFYVVLACLIDIALFCCLPCIIVILYVIAGREGVLEVNLSILLKYIFQLLNNVENASGGVRSILST